MKHNGAPNEILRKYQIHENEITKDKEIKNILKVSLVVLNHKYKYS